MTRGNATVSTPSKERLDVLLVAAGLAPSREQAKRLIMAGKVLVNDTVIDRPGEMIPEGAEIRCKGPLHPYVGRGGVKLQGALEAFSVPVEGRTAADLGASTGGFTDCLLKNGAVKVFAVDVGYGQLAFKIRKDPRVVVLDRTNARRLTSEKLGEPVDLVVMDLSFISILKVLDAVRSILRDGGDVISLVKPQFEIGKGKVGKGGIVRDAKDHAEVLANLLRGTREAGFGVLGIAPSPVTGTKGNIEFWFHLRPGTEHKVGERDIHGAVGEAHEKKRETRKR
jgi:23S rRNA (cytidine1920-2'-O)/16S rRNA (cytidine1409-2'-O)-methyltransferase